jgi:hypothetical protein
VEQPKDLTALLSFGPEDRHRALHLAELLEAGGLDPVLDFDEGTAYLSVPAHQREQAESLARLLEADYDATVGVIEEGRPRLPFGDRMGAYLFGVVLPFAVMVGSLIVLVRDGPPAERAGAAVAFIVTLAWVGAFVVFRRKGAV